MGQRRAAIVGGAMTVAALAIVFGYAVKPQPPACGDAGYLPVVPVHLTGAAAAVDGLRFCIDGRCSPVPAARAGATGTPTPNGLPEPQHDDAHPSDWTLPVSSRPSPRAVTLTAYDGGRPSVTRSFAVSWNEPSATGCGEPVRSTALTFRIP